jgi:glycerol-3-phosphate dehydrogenase
MVLHRRLRVLDTIEISESGYAGIDPLTQQRLFGRYGTQAQTILEGPPEELEPIESTPYVWGELRLAARQEGVVHLEDLLLRRVRLGLLLPQGAMGQMEKIAATARPELGWDDLRWKDELRRYQDLIRERFSLP